MYDELVRTVKQAVQDMKRVLPSTIQVHYCYFSLLDLIIITQLLNNSSLIN